MALRSIEIISPIGASLSSVENVIKQALANIEFMLKRKIPIEIKRTTDFRAAARYSGGARPPLVIINGSLEFCGKVPDYEALKTKLLQTIKEG